MSGCVSACVCAPGRRHGRRAAAGALRAALACVRARAPQGAGACGGVTAAPRVGGMTGGCAASDAFAPAAQPPPRVSTRPRRAPRSCAGTAPAARRSPQSPPATTRCQHTHTHAHTVSTMHACARTHTYEAGARRAPVDGERQHLQVGHARHQLATSRHTAQCQRSTHSPLCGSAMRVKCVRGAVSTHRHVRDAVSPQVQVAHLAQRLGARLGQHILL